MAEETTVVAAPPVETSAAETVEVDNAPVTETEAPEEAVEEPSAEEESSATEQVESGEADSPEEPAEQPDELAEFKGSAGARLRELCKSAPGLSKVLDQFPKVKDSIVASLKRDAALRDQNITVAELREYRERLPNGLQDLQTIEQELGELGRIDGAFYGKRGGELISYMHQADPEAAISMFRELPKQWARLDPESYSQTFSAIISATLRKDRAPELVYRAYQRAKAAGDKDSESDLAELYNYLNSFGQREEDSPDARRYKEREQQLSRKEQETAAKNQEAFNSSFIRESERFQRNLVRNNPLFKKLPQAIPEAKKARMVDEVRNRVISHLERSRAFMSQMEPAYKSMDLQKILEIQSGSNGWQPWIVNMYVRKVLAEETPGFIEGNRSAVATKRAAAARTGIANRAPAKPPTPAKPGDRRKTANDFTLEEIMRGEADHLIK
jgi:hypothetical protein